MASACGWTTVGPAIIIISFSLRFNGNHLLIRFRLLGFSFIGFGCLSHSANAIRTSSRAEAAERNTTPANIYWPETFDPLIKINKFVGPQTTDAHSCRVICHHCRRLPCQTIVAIFIDRRRCSSRRVFCHVYFFWLNFRSSFRHFHFFLSLFRSFLFTVYCTRLCRHENGKKYVMHLLIAPPNMSYVRQYFFYLFFFHFAFFVFMNSSHRLRVVPLHAMPTFRL